MSMLTKIDYPQASDLMSAMDLIFYDIPDNCSLSFIFTVSMLVQVARRWSDV